MQVYVQKSISTARPRSEASVSGLSPGVLNQSSVSVNSGAAPRAGSWLAAASSVACDALAGAAWTAVEDPPQLEEPLAGANLAWRPVISCRRPVTEPEH